MLFSGYYADARYQRFLNDLSEKDHVLTMWNQNGRGRQLIGFSTVKRHVMAFPEPHVCIYSGDTVVDKAFWGRKDLQRAFLWYIFESKLLSFNKPVFWFLISKGHKTYMMMRKNFQRSFPNHKQKTPERIKQIMDHYYSAKFQDAYSKETSLIRCGKRDESIKHKYRDIKSDILGDSDARFFFNSNPDYSRGTQLACIAELRWPEFYRHFRKYVMR